ncbi:hypothetical protein BU25DRAFT_342979 [Macroventuria anomochaeta]|uniref:Uncharacterized protein n=1 Tax=Macroventuria anomochaeta TaxID=301207 RepID=A0ACB6S042_9PLEO|nr:uncharacterized protein BU25DRAFT_342979 [Macroventuria anomochaeta]KAF2626768.1 hypothetical protein BU25DRAFT_342979 [Macroventuria anomochaeta]
MVRQWHSLAFEYASVSLTYESDISPALQGIAARFQESRHTEYLAGLWADFLPLDLFRAVKRASNVWCLFRECADYRAPTWSWASRIDAQLTWLNWWEHTIL